MAHEITATAARHIPGHALDWYTDDETWMRARMTRGVARVAFEDDDLDPVYWYRGIEIEKRDYYARLTMDCPWHFRLSRDLYYCETLAEVRDLIDAHRDGETS